MPIRFVRSMPGELLNRANAGLVQTLHLLAPHVSDPAQMIVLVPPALAACGVLTHGTVPDGIRIGRALATRSLDEATADGAVVRVEVSIQQAIVLAGAEHDDHPFGRDTLKAFELLGVEAQLQNEVGLGVPRELGVPGLVAPIAQRRWPFDADEKVTDATPLVVREHALVDHVSATAHRRHRPCGVGVPSHDRGRRTQS